MLTMLFGAAILVMANGPGLAAGVAITAQRDTTLIEDPNGALANGAGPSIFAGRTNAGDNGVRRGLLRFDVAAVTAGNSSVVANIAGVAVILTNITGSNVAPREYRLHRVLADWGEGTSYSTGGGGAPAVAGDATWLHGSYPDVFWMHNGAQFDGEPSARLVIAGPGVYRFEGEGLLRDLGLWAREPERNFGWILIGDETERQTVRAFASRENPDPGLRPVLEIIYRGRP